MERSLKMAKEFTEKIENSSEFRVQSSEYINTRNPEHETRN
jgi:hypothetical protein